MSLEYLRHYSFDYASESSNSIDDFASKIQAMIKKALYASHSSLYMYLHTYTYIHTEKVTEVFQVDTHKAH